MELLAAVRADDQDLPLFLHILGALCLVAAVAAAAYYLFRARRDGSPALARVGYRTLLFGAIPSYLVTRVAAEWIADKQNLADADFAWITIGYIVTDVGLLALIVATVASGIAARRAEGSVGRGPAVAGWTLSFLLVAYTVALWAMAAKPI